MLYNILCSLIILIQRVKQVCVIVSSDTMDSKLFFKCVLCATKNNISGYIYLKYKTYQYIHPERVGRNFGVVVRWSFTVVYECMHDLPSFFQYFLCSYKSFQIISESSISRLYLFCIFSLQFQIVSYTTKMHHLPSLKVD